MASRSPARQILTASRHSLNSTHRERSLRSPIAAPCVCQRSISIPAYIPSESGELRSRPSSTDFPSQHHLATHTSPRWARTPEGMSMPVRFRPKDANVDWVCNDSPAKLDEVYKRLLGSEGPNMLSEETKWLAVTHKSFDQGKRGFNERLAYMGRRITELQASLALLSQPVGPGRPNMSEKDSHGRLPFAHPSLKGLENLTPSAKQILLTHKRLAQLAEGYGIPQILRWKPRRADNLLQSGLEVAVAQTLYAIVGALALEKGGLVANRFAQEKILGPLGITNSWMSEMS